MKPMTKIALPRLPLVACGDGGSSNDQPNVQKEPVINTDYSNLALGRLEPGSLRQAAAPISLKSTAHR